MIKEQRVGFLLLIGIIIFIELLIHREFLFYKTSKNQELPIHISEELIASNSKKNQVSKSKLELFNPNDYSKEDWKEIGFSEGQTEVILKYKNMLGGKFNSKDQIKACFVISEEKYKELSPFLLLPEKGNSNDRYKVSYPSSRKYELKKFDPNLYTIKDWKSIGFSEKQAEIILKYKNIVGGKFVSKEQLKKCFVISEEKYRELTSFILLPEKASYQEKRIQSAVIGKKELNSASVDEINLVVRDISIAKKVVGFRKGLGGFVSKDQIKDVFDITPEMIAIILDNFVLDVSKVSKINLGKATENELQNQIYLRRYKNKIIKAQEAGEDPIKVIPKSDTKYNFILLYLEK